MSVESRSFPDFFNSIFQREFPGGSTVKSVTFVVTENCQFDCSYCYQKNKSKKSMSLETGKKLIDRMFEEFRDNGGIFNDEIKAVILDFIGGEPFLKVDLMDGIIEYYKWKAVSEGRYDLAINYMIAITTNGGLSLHPKSLKLVEKNRERISVSITIDGNKELHDACRRLAADGGPTYDLVEKAVLYYRDRFDLKSTKLTIAPENLEYLTDAVFNLWGLGIVDVHANAVYENVWETKHGGLFYEQLVKLADRLLEDENWKRYAVTLFDSSIGQPRDADDPEENQNWCGGTGKMVAFDVSGKAFPCLRYMEYCVGKKDDTFVIGDADSGFLKTDCQSCTFNELSSITRRSQSTDECFFCPVASGCGWCSAYNYEETGTVNQRVTYICPMHKARVLANCYYYNKRSLVDPGQYPVKLNLTEQDATRFISKEEFDMLKSLEQEAFAHRGVTV